MGCLSGPKKVQASKGEKELLSITRQQMAEARSLLDPLEKRERDQAVKLDTPMARQASVNRSTAAAREVVSGSEPRSPNATNQLSLSHKARTRALTDSAVAGEDTATRRSAGQKAKTLSHGLQLSLSGSQGIARNAATEAGNLAAQSAASQYVKDARTQALGSAVGSLATAGAYKAGWFEPKSAATPKAPKSKLNLTWAGGS